MNSKSRWIRDVERHFWRSSWRKEMHLFRDPSEWFRNDFGIALISFYLLIPFFHRTLFFCPFFFCPPINPRLLSAFCMYLSVFFLSLFPSFFLSLHSSNQIDQKCICAHLTFSLSVWLSDCLSVCLSIYLSVYLFICLSVCFSVFLNIRREMDAEKNENNLSFDESNERRIFPTASGTLSRPNLQAN